MLSSKCALPPENIGDGTQQSPTESQGPAQSGTCLTPGKSIATFTGSVGSVPRETLLESVRENPATPRHTGRTHKTHNAFWHDMPRLIWIVGIRTTQTCGRKERRKTEQLFFSAP